METICTIFENLKGTDKPHYISIEKSLERIKTNLKTKKIVDKLRAEKDEAKQKEIKNTLPCVCFSGKFTFRNDKSCETHSGVAIMDFDKLENVKDKINELKEDKFIYACWISPSGNGVKALVKFPPDIQSHREYYNGLLQNYKGLDPTSINISRICYESFDPEIYINEDSEIWETKQIEQKIINTPLTFTHDYKIVNVAAQMIRNSSDGEKHNVLLKAAKLVGGYVAIGKINEAEAIKSLSFEIDNKNIVDKRGAMQTIQDGINYGKLRPISEAIAIEREERYIRNVEGNYDFIASESDMLDYLQSYFDGTLKMGLDLHIIGLEEYFLAKYKTFALFIGLDNVGKSTILWYLAVLTAKYYDWKTLIYSGENDDETVKRKILEFYIGKPFRQMDNKERENANNFYLNHFKIVSSKKDVYSCVQLIELGQVLFETDWKFDCFIIEPYNSLKFDTSLKMQKYDYNYYCLSEVRLFTKRYCTVWMAAHTISEAARNIDNEGNVKVPIKSQVEGGQPFCSRADDIIILHRKTKSQDYKVTEFHIDKIKDHDTGGKPSPFDSPIKIRMIDGNCGFVDSELTSWNPMIESNFDKVLNEQKESNEAIRLNPMPINLEFEDCPY